MNDYLAFENIGIVQLCVREGMNLFQQNLTSLLQNKYKFNTLNSQNQLLYVVSVTFVN